ncbi:dihydroorotase [Salinigranum halophilum]|jgi:dihydropyrimidinase|uniref:dihydroorotase n=1 Tax=Salinigranum halophilum TaxID=2565931 RepID=UPI0010A815BE|nr:amidohydrolase family protein [Salinigranum halophilum]
MPVDTIIAHGDVVTPNSVRQTSVAIDDGTIVALGTRDQLPAARRTVDASGKLVMPGVVDPHVHIDEVPENRAGTYRAETRAAARGGVTTLIDFAWQGGDRRIPNNDKGLLDGIRNKRSKHQQSFVDFSVHGVLHRETEETLDELEAAVDAGVTSFKMFMSNYPVGVTNGFVNMAFNRIAELDAVAAVHTEDPSICEALTAKFKREGRGEPDQYPLSRPDYTEAMAADDALQMAVDKGVKYYGVHTTSEKAAETIASYQEDESHIRAETCTHYTTLDDSVYEERGTYPQIAPPIRKPRDIEAMFEHLEGGALSVVSTDHSVYHEEYKAVDNWWESPFGANSLQASLPVFHDEAVNKRGYSYPFLVRLMCANPAKTFGMPNKGTLEPGTDADVVVFDPDDRYTITARDNESNSTFSIYEGREVSGKVHQTYLRGNLVWDDGAIVAEPGVGEFVERDLPEWTQ